jgi:hypothetical protein
MIDYVSIQDNVLKSREGTICPVPKSITANCLKYNKLN